MATAADAQRARNEAEPQAESLYRAAVAYVATRSAVADGDATTDDDDSVVVRAGIALALALILSIGRRNGRDVYPEDMNVDARELADEYGPQYAETAVKDATAHLATVATRQVKNNPDVTRADIRQAFRNDTAWVKAAAKTTATQAASETVIDMLPLIDEHTGAKHDLLWVSRGDHRVRSTHRKLHGAVRAFGKPFKRFPSGQALRFPGDPLAPLSEVINCRCGLLLVPAKDARDAMDVFEVAEAEWDVIDSLRASVGGNEPDPGYDQAIRDLIGERTR